MFVVELLVHMVLGLIGLGCLAAFPTLREEGHLYVTEILGYVVWAVTGFAFYYVYHEGGRLLPGLLSGFPFLAVIAEQLLIDVGFFLAIGLQFHANTKKTDDGPTHPKQESYEGNGQAYPWDEE